MLPGCPNRPFCCMSNDCFSTLAICARRKLSNLFGNYHQHIVIGLRCERSDREENFRSLYCT